MMKHKKHKADFMVISFLWIVSLIIAGFLVWLITHIFINGIPHVTLDFLSSPNDTKHRGILPMILNTIFIICLSLVFSIPTGIGTALYMTEYSKQGKIINIIRFSIETLGGIPSILYGLFGFIFFVKILNFGFSILAGSLTLSIMVLPTIIRTTEESLKAVPASYREGSFALGATNLTTIKKVTLPCAMPGIIAAIILSVGRIIGESAAVYLTAGMGKNIANSMMNSGRTLSVHLYILAKEGISFDETYATASVLVILIAFINMTASYLGNKIKKRGVK